jgi:hypothetical protein
MLVMLCDLRCSETGAAFFNDMFSKHAMHSGGAEEVLFAGAWVGLCALLSHCCCWGGERYVE